MESQYKKLDGTEGILIINKNYNLINTFLRGEITLVSQIT